MIQCRQVDFGTGGPFEGIKPTHRIVACADQGDRGRKRTIEFQRGEIGSRDQALTNHAFVL